MDLIFLEKRITPQGLYFFKKEISFLLIETPFKPTIKDFLYLIIFN